MTAPTSNTTIAIVQSFLLVHFRTFLSWDQIMNFTLGIDLPRTDSKGPYLCIEKITQAI